MLQARGKVVEPRLARLRQAELRVAVRGPEHALPHVDDARQIERIPDAGIGALVTVNLREALLFAPILRIQPRPELHVDLKTPEHQIAVADVGDVPIVAVGCTLCSDRHGKRLLGQVAAETQRFTNTLHEAGLGVRGVQRDRQPESALRGMCDGTRLRQPAHQGMGGIGNHPVHAQSE